MMKDLSAKNQVANAKQDICFVSLLPRKIPSIYRKEPHPIYRVPLHMIASYWVSPGKRLAAFRRQASQK